MRVRYLPRAAHRIRPPRHLNDIFRDARHCSRSFVTMHGESDAEDAAEKHATIMRTAEWQTRHACDDRDAPKYFARRQRVQVQAATGERRTR